MLQNTAGRRISVTTADFDMLDQEMRDGKIVFEAEHVDRDAHLDQVIDKPWGHEYRIYADHFFDIWKLRIRPGHSTSLHCHPRKETVLVCLSGKAEIHFLNHLIEVAAPNYICIDRGVFHSTTNVGGDDLDLIEIETPRNKLDLVRMHDHYGRARAKYERETSSIEVPTVEPALSIFGAKMRAGDSSGRYQFQVLSGLDLAKHRYDNAVCLVALGVRQALNREIQILLHDQVGIYPFRDNQQYFSILADYSSVN